MTVVRVETTGRRVMSTGQLGEPQHQQMSAGWCSALATKQQAAMTKWDESATVGRCQWEGVTSDLTLAGALTSLGQSQLLSMAIH